MRFLVQLLKVLRAVALTRETFFLDEILDHDEQHFFILIFCEWRHPVI